MLTRKTITACAVAALAMVFSVQQGEHGPLVVYKLQLPQKTARAPAGVKPSETHKDPAPAIRTLKIPAIPTDLPGPAPDAVSPQPRLSPLQPTILGTVVMPASPRPMANGFLSPAPLAASAGKVTFQPKADLPPELVMINEETGEPLTLDDVQDALGWRQETVEKLRDVPVAPRF